MKLLLFVVTIYSLSLSACGNVQSSPESTLQGYLSCLETADEACVLKHYYGLKSFHTGKPQSIDFKITKRLVYGPQDAKSWNDKGIIPLALEGDVSLDVLQKTNDIEFIYSYNFRQYGDQWLIYSHTVWEVDVENP